MRNYFNCNIFIQLSFDYDKVCRMIDICYSDEDDTSNTTSRAIYRASNILCSRKNEIFKCFFRKNPREPTSPLSKDETEDESGYSYNQDPPFRCDMFETVEKSMVINGEESKYQEFVQDQKETLMDKLFNIVFEDPDDVNLTAFGHFLNIIKSFVDSQFFYADFLKYVFSRRLLLGRLVEHIVHPSGYQACQLVAAISKRSVDGSRSSLSVFLMHRYRALEMIFNNILESHDADKELLAESSCEMWVEFIKDHPNICDSNHYIDKILLDNDNMGKLLQHLISVEVNTI